MTTRVSRILALLLLASWPMAAAAQEVLGVEQFGSLLVFPKIVASATTDTMVEIFNSTASAINARCFYIDGLPPRTRTEFRLRLTQQQPTHWVVSSGRPLDPGDLPCSGSSASCSGSGLDPGNIPPRGGFQGELICVQTLDDGSVVFGNALAGQATIRDLASGDVAQYAALRVAGDVNGAAGDPLCLGKGCEGQLNACPRYWNLNHVSDVTLPMPAGAAAQDETELVVARCSQNLSTMNLGATFMVFNMTNELEQRFGGGVLIPGWASVTFGSLGLDRAALGTVYVQSEFSTSSSEGGLFIIAHQRRTTGGLHSRTASAALHLHHSSQPAGIGDTITLPPLEGGAQ